MIEKHEHIKVYVCSEDATAYIGTSEVELHGYGNGDGELVLRDVSFGVDEIRDAQVKTLKADVAFYKQAWERSKMAHEPANSAPFTVSREVLARQSEKSGIRMEGLLGVFESLDIIVEEREHMPELRSAVESANKDLGLYLDASDVEEFALGLLNRGVRAVG